MPNLLENPDILEHIHQASINLDSKLHHPEIDLHLEASALAGNPGKLINPSSEIGEATETDKFYLASEGKRN